METKYDYQVSTERRLLDVAMIHDFLRSSYWAPDIPRSVVEKSIEHSLCFGVYHGKAQVGFARVISDFATFAYIADVFIVPAHRGKGASKLLMRTILAHPELQGLRRLLLATKDAHGLYAQFGFQPLSNPDLFMSVHHPDVYRAKSKGDA
jgi:N-acetylglutamate synthase-like GNAT family acetyltransferase